MQCDEFGQSPRYFPLVGNRVISYRPGYQALESDTSLSFEYDFRHARCGQIERRLSEFVGDVEMRPVFEQLGDYHVQGDEVANRALVLQNYTGVRFSINL